MTPDPGCQEEAVDLLTSHFTSVYRTLESLIQYCESGVHPGRDVLSKARALIPEQFLSTTKKGTDASHAARDRRDDV